MKSPVALSLLASIFLSASSLAADYEVEIRLMECSGDIPNGSTKLKLLDDPTSVVAATRPVPLSASKPAQIDETTSYSYPTEYSDDLQPTQASSTFLGVRGAVSI